MNLNLRKSVFQVHRWTGLTIGLVILMMALTGAVNLFRPALEPVINGELLTVATCSERLPLDTLAANARTAHSMGSLDYIRLTAGEDGEAVMPSARVRFADPQVDVYLNPCTGQVLGERARYGGVLATVEQLHILRFSEDKLVRSITGVCAIVFGIVLIGGGIYMWWPRRSGGLKSALTLNTRLTGKAWHLNLHKTAGVYASLILLMLILTGLPLAFDWYRQGMYHLTGSPLPPKPGKSVVLAGASRLSMEAFWQRAQALMPQPADALLKFPTEKADSALEGFLIARGAPHPNARTLLSIDAYSGKTLRFTPYAANSLGHKLYFWTLSFHTGQVGGVPMQIGLLFGALTVPIMAYTGFASFLRRRRAPLPRAAEALDVRVNRICDEATDIKTFELVSANGVALPGFTAGAHVNVNVDAGLVRQYSLCNDPSESGRYLIAVKLAADSRGGSRAMHELAPGELLSIGAPKNHFPLDRSARHHVLLASGIGITPLMSMARRLLARGASFELHYFTRSIEHTAFHAELSEPRFRSKVNFHYAVEPDRLHETLQRLLGHKVDGAHLYLCGSARFMGLVEDLAAARWPAEAIHTEYFNADPMASAGLREPFEITLARSGGTYSVPAARSIINVLREKAGCVIETSCEQGVCGTCLTGVLSGTPDHRDAFLSAAERRAGQKMLLCVSRAKSKRLVLDL